MSKPASTRPKVTGVTIDSPHTKDMDDAIHVIRHDQGWTVQVHIADVAAAIHLEKPLGARARQSVATQYYHTGAVPMLPRKLSEDELSLWDGKSRKTVTVEFEVDLEGKRSKETLFLSQCTSLAKLTYEEIPAIKVDLEHPHHKLVLDALELSHHLLIQRRKAGALLIYDFNTGWVTTEEGCLKKLIRREDTIGYILVQELMIAANEVVAMWAVKNNLPIIFRNHTPIKAAPPREDLMSQLEVAMTTPVIDMEVMRMRFNLIMGKASYGPTLQGHYGLNLPAYTHFTSPIRRYADLVVHRQVKAYLKGHNLPYTQESLEVEATHINTRTLEIQTTRSQIAKEKANRKANIASADVDRMSQLTDKEFERVCRLQTRGDEPSEAFVEAFLNRAPKAPVLWHALILASAPATDVWKPLRQAVVNYLGSNPQDILSVLSLSMPLVPWTEFKPTTNPEGPDHDRVFHSKATLCFDGIPKQGPRMTAVTLKRAEAFALLALWAEHFGLALPEMETVVRKEASKDTPRYVEPESPVSALYEYCQQKRYQTPLFSFSREGADHSPVFLCDCEVAGKIGSGRGSTKQEAKADAAKRLYRTLYGA